MKTFGFHNQGATAVVVAGLLALVVVVGSGFWSPLPRRPDFKRHAARMYEVVPIEKVETVFSRANLKEMVMPTNLLSPFYTEFYKPPPAANPPATKTVEVVYQGSYESANGRKLAFVNVGGKSVTVPAGSGILDGWSVKEIGLKMLILTNAAGESIALEFRGTNQIKIPK